MTVEQILFLILAAAGLVLAAATVALRNLVRCAFALIGCLFVVAAFYAMLDASLLAAAQVVVYIGAIATLIVLVVMLTRREQQDRPPQAHGYWPVTVLLGAVAFAGIAWGLSHYVFFNLLPPPLIVGDSIVELGKALIDPTRFLIPFEAVSVLLLSALIGAVLVAGGTRTSKTNVPGNSLRFLVALKRAPRNDKCSMSSRAAFRPRGIGNARIDETYVQGRSLRPLYPKVHRGSG